MQPQCDGGPSAQAGPPEVHVSFKCPVQGCNRSYYELWKLRAHCRAPPRKSSRHGGHGCELSHCPRCGRELSPSQPHLGCLNGLAAPRQAVKRRRQQTKNQEERSLRRSVSSEEAVPPAQQLALRRAISTDAAVPPLPKQLDTVQRTSSSPAIASAATPAAQPPTMLMAPLPPPKPSPAPAAPPVSSPPAQQQSSAPPAPQQQQQEAELAAACLQAVAANPAALEAIKVAAARSRQGGPQQAEAGRLPLEQVVTAFVRAIMDTQQMQAETLTTKTLAAAEAPKQQDQQQPQHSSDVSYSGNLSSSAPLLLSHPTAQHRHCDSPTTNQLPPPDYATVVQSPAGAAATAATAATSAIDHAVHSSAATQSFDSQQDGVFTSALQELVAEYKAGMPASASCSQVRYGQHWPAPAAAAPQQQLPAGSTGSAWSNPAADSSATGGGQQLAQDVWAAQLPPLPPRPPHHQQPLHHHAQMYCPPQPHPQPQPQPQWQTHPTCGNWGLAERQPTIGELDLGCLSYGEYMTSGGPTPGSLHAGGHDTCLAGMQGVQGADWLQDIEWAAKPIDGQPCSTPHDSAASFASML